MASETYDEWQFENQDWNLDPYEEETQNEWVQLRDALNVSPFIKAELVANPVQKYVDDWDMDTGKEIRIMQFVRNHGKTLLEVDVVNAYTSETGAQIKWADSLPTFCFLIISRAQFARDQRQKFYYRVLRADEEKLTEQFVNYADGLNEQLSMDGEIQNYSCESKNFEAQYERGGHTQRINLGFSGKYGDVFRTTSQFSNEDFTALSESIYLSAFEQDIGMKFKKGKTAPEFCVIEEFDFHSSSSSY